LNGLVIPGAYRRNVLTQEVFDTSGPRVASVRCSGGDRWSPEELVTSASVVLVRRGVFRRRVGGASSLVDVTTGYLQRPGEFQQVAHPAGGDTCTSIGVPDELGDRFAHAGPLVVSPAADLAHRRLATRAAGADVADLAAELLAALLPPSDPAPPLAAVRRVDEVRAAMHLTPNAALPDLAGRVGWSEWYLSRMFHRVTGTTISTYRRRLRVRAALDALTEGRPGRAGVGLAAIAARTGFADQAHLTRAMGREIGLPPAAARRLLRGR
jgi:AraC-like DNA-binding protein